MHLFLKNQGSKKSMLKAGLTIPLSRARTKQLFCPNTDGPGSLSFGNGNLETSFIEPQEIFIHTSMDCANMAQCVWLQLCFARPAEIVSICITFPLYFAYREVSREKKKKADFFKEKKQTGNRSG